MCQTFAHAQINYGIYNLPVEREFNRLYGKSFPAMELEDANGNLIRTDSLAGKTIYMEFWFTACPPCIKQIPFAKKLQQFFASDTNIVFVNICIENIDRKDVWKTMVKEKEMEGIQLFYARNRPQKVNLLREFFIDDYPTCILINDNQQVTGYQAPVPSQTGWVHWAIAQAAAGVTLAEAYQQMIQNSNGYKIFMDSNREYFSGIPKL